MINETIIQFSNGTALPITVTASTSTGQFTINVILSLLGLAFILYWLGTNMKFSFKEVIGAYRMKRLTGRPTLFVYHKMESGLFGSVEMIDEKTMLTITKFLHKHRGKEVNIVLHTPGGIVFHSQAIGQEIFSGPSRVHLYVPVYAMSGGTFLAMSAYKLYMSNTAALGPVDPQLGHFWGGYSSDSHNKVVRKKGKTAGDSSIAFANEGSKCEVEIKKDLQMFLSMHRGLSCQSAEVSAKELTDGRYTHGKRFGIMDVARFRLVQTMNDKEYAVMVKAL